MFNKKEFSGDIIMIGYGSIGKGLLPLLKKHINFIPSQLTIIDPRTIKNEHEELSEYTVIKSALTKENHFKLLQKLITKPGNSLIINVSVDVDSCTLIDTAQKLESLYIDTATETWPGFYSDLNSEPATRTNYALRERVLALQSKYSDGKTAISCCGANPGMISWLVKEALVNLRNEINPSLPDPVTQEDWAKFMYKLNVKGLHVAERDTQISSYERKPGIFANTWSVPGCISECIQPAELGWGTHEKTLPANGHQHQAGCQSAIYLDTCGGETVVKTWVPTGPQEAFLITHNESISLADYFTLKIDGELVFRPTVHYAYRPSSLTIDSIHELMETGGKKIMTEKIILESEIISGEDHLGVLLYGHEKNAYWYGSKLSIEETRLLVSNQNATGLQVTSALISAIIWMLDNQSVGIVETENIDYKECLNVQRPYLGKVEGHFTDWSPAEGSDASERWQFSNILLNKNQVS